MSKEKYVNTQPDESILINLSGRGDKDIDFVVEKFDIPTKD